MSNPLCIIAIKNLLEWDNLGVLKFDICETLETRSRRRKVVFEVVHLIREGE
jgi:hypothetical protein